jgi:hypothetical protein
MSNGEKEILMEKNIILELKKVEFNKRRFNTYFGNIGEMLAEEKLSTAGFETWGLKPFHAGSRPKTEIFYDNLFSCMHFLYESNERCYYDGLTYEETREKGIRMLKEFFGERFLCFKNYMERIGVIGKIGIVGASQIKMVEPKSRHVYTPDLVAKKNGEIYIVEVKTNSGISYLKGEKLKGLLSAKKFGLVPLLIKLKLNLDATDLVVEKL